MKNYFCYCGNNVYFDNTICLKCNRTLGFIPSVTSIGAFEQNDKGKWISLSNHNHSAVYRKCRNYSEEDVCNWMVPEDDAHELCVSCRLNKTIPNLNKDENRKLWFRVEQAKRRLMYSLLTLGLPIVGREDDPEAGLAFDFLEDLPEQISRFMTGHLNGLITINIEEANSSAREETRINMKERYRTLLGHFRHEIGHYYWDRLVKPSNWLVGFREVFGDERTDYQKALREHYASGPKSGWEEEFISAYASAHPLEDWGETFSHYLHMMDTIETAHSYGFAIKGESITHPGEVLSPTEYASGNEIPTIDVIVEDWISLTLLMNALNRSMGMPDPYPFALTARVREKLSFVHDVVRETVLKGSR